MSEKSDIIQAWTSALTDNAEQHVHAMSMLHESIDDDAPSLPLANRWMQAVTPQRRKMRRLVMSGLAILAVLMATTCLFLAKIQLDEMDVIDLTESQMIEPFAPKKELKINDLTSEQELLLYGDYHRSGEAEQMKALWESDPKNPAFYAEYVLHYYREKRTLPTDFLKIANEIDPDNAWFTCLAAEAMAVKTCEKKNVIHPRSRVVREDVERAPYSAQASMSRQIVYEHAFLNRTNAELALALWRKSLGQNKYNDYQSEMQRLRYPALERRENYQDHLKSMVYLSSANELDRNYQLDFLLTTFLMDETATPEQRKQLLDDMEAYTERILRREPVSIVDISSLLHLVDGLAKAVQVSEPGQLDSSKVEIWQKRNAAMRAYLDDRIAYRYMDSEAGPVEKHGAMLARIRLSELQKVVRKPSPFHLKDLAPLRLAEHAVYFRAACLLLIIVFTLLLPYLLLVKRQRLQIRLSEEAWLAIPMRTHVMTALIGLSPLYYYFILYYFTPFAGAEYSPIFFVPPPMISFFGAILLMLALPRLLIHRFTAPFLRMANSVSRWHLRLGWFCAVLVLLPMHLLPLSIEKPSFSNYVNTFSDLLHQYSTSLIIVGYTPMLMWLLWHLIRHLWSRDIYQRVMKSMQQKVLMSSTLASIFAFALLWSGLHPWEKYWVQRDELMKVTPDMTTLGAYEALCVKTLHKEMLELMDWEEER